MNLSSDCWRLVLSLLHDHVVEPVDDDDPMHEEWYAALQEVLQWLAETLPLEEFLRILPPHGTCGGSASGRNDNTSTDDFQAYIKMCRRNQQAADIRDLIVTTGKKLLATLSL